LIVLDEEEVVGAIAGVEDFEGVGVGVGVVDVVVCPPARP